ncbi:hypothetical protein AB1Y20_017713 [Prymnesium parvum]|uniref:Tetratricopeptide repeat protein n=1 Tax=Prymnesium parvum TaxID=97485 RepID=A0AB34JMJ2_PRYPA|mmetsp:Transcript_24348/g.60388  ORF Transcript_24348/g.60388 Transcript_24348/m.60388 type:complete len:369 (-) Transcript_24348:79-1185(-)
MVLQVQVQQAQRRAGDACTRLASQMRTLVLASVIATNTLLSPFPAGIPLSALADDAPLATSPGGAASKGVSSLASGATPMVKAYGLEAYGKNEEALKKMSDANSRLDDKAVKRVLDSGLELAQRAADPETQQVDPALLRKAEERFTLIIEELAPSYVGGYTNRANVRVALRDYEAAVRDYTDALRLAPLGRDAWLIKVNRGATLLALGRPNEALEDLEQAVTMSKNDYLALLGRGSALHRMGKYDEAARDYGAVIDKAPTDIQPFWLRYGLELWQVGRQTEGLGIIRRVANKFDLEPECALAASSILYADGLPSDQEEALRRWKLLPAPVRSKALAVDTAAREWPPAAVEAAVAFRKVIANNDRQLSS